MKVSYDVIILGGGPGGIHAAGLLAAAGKKVALVEKDRLGGCCSNTGCIPTKALIMAAKQPSFDWKQLQQRLTELTDSNREGIRLVLLSRGVHIYDGEAVMISPKKVQVSVYASGQEYILTGDAVILATGSEPLVPEALQGISGVETTDTFWHLQKLPDRLIIAGGGVTGCELACALAGHVSELVLVEKKERILEEFSDSACEILLEHLEKSGVTVYTGCEILSYSESDGKGVAVFSNGEIHDTEGLLVSAGRTPVFPKGWKPEWTECVHIRCIGDVKGDSWTAYGAKAQAERCAAELLQTGEGVQGEEILPTCVFTGPELAKVGLSKAQAQRLGYHAAEGKAPFFALGMAKIAGDTDGYISLCRDVDTDLLLGAEIAGGNACELIHLLQVYVVHKIPCREMKKIVFAHPTYGEGIRIALDETYGGSVELPYRKRRKGV